MADHNPHPLLLAFIFRYFATERGRKPFKMDEKVVVVVAKKKKRPNMFVKFYMSLTIEPVIFMHAIGLAIINGSQVSTNLLIWKICNLELNFTEDICSNLTDEANKEYEEIVQTEVNNFQMLSQWISSGLLSRQGIKPVSIKYTNLKVSITVQLTCLFCLDSATLLLLN